MTLPPKTDTVFGMLRKEHNRFSPGGEVLLRSKSTGRVVTLPYGFR